MRWLEGNSMHEVHVSKTRLELYRSQNGIGNEGIKKRTGHGESKTILETYRYQNSFSNEGIKNALAMVIAKRFWKHMDIKTRSAMRVSKTHWPW
jgi:hypothetical protein